MSDPFKVGIIGCGAIHTLHAEAIMENPKTKLLAICDINEEKAKKVATLYGCDYFTDYKELLNLDNIDAVHICTPHYLHAPMSIAAMRAGKHVLTEKPMAITVADAEEMIKVSGETRKMLGICFQNRFNTTSERIKEILESGELGRIIGGKAFVTWHRDKSYYKSGEWRGTWDKEGGGVLINQAIHTLDLLQWFIGDIEKIKASVDTRLLKDVIEVEDTAEATLFFKNGASALFYATNSYCTDSPIEIELICEKAVVKLAEELIVKYSDGRIESFADSYKASGEKAYWGCSHKVLIDEFYNSLKNGGNFKIDGKQGIRTVKTIQAIYASDKKREYIKIS